VKKIQCLLKVLSPLHIGGLVTEVNNMDFFYDTKYLYHVSETRMAQALKEEGLIEDFINFMSSGQASLQEYLETPPYIPKEDLRKRLEGKKIALTRPPVKRINSFRLFKQDPLTRKPYIPGSTIKGALRSDILFMLMDKGALKAEEVEKTVRKSKRRDRKKVGNMVNRLLESADLQHTRPGPHRDWLRALKISDAFCRDEEPSFLQEVKVVSLNKNGKGFHWGAGGASIYVESLKPGTTFTFTMEIDEWLLQIMELARKTQFDLQDIFNNKTKLKYMRKAEQIFWEQSGIPLMNTRQEKHLADGANLRLGWGSGYLGTTIGAYLIDKVRLNIGKTFYNTRYDTFPNSRKVIVDNDIPVDTLGWCKLEQE
jgi:CRISPR-associated protein Csm5